MQARLRTRLSCMMHCSGAAHSSGTTDATGKALSATTYGTLTTSCLSCFQPCLDVIPLASCVDIMC